MAKKSKKYIKIKKSHEKQIFLFGRLMASEMASIIKKEIFSFEQ